MKRVIAIITITMAVLLTACGGSIKLDPEVEQLKQEQIQYWDLFEKTDDTMILEAFYYAHYFNDASSASALSDIPEGFLRSIAYLDIYNENGTKGKLIADSAWQAMDELQKGDQDKFLDNLQRSKDVFEEAVGATVEEYGSDEHYEELMRLFKVKN